MAISPFDIANSVIGIVGTVYGIVDSLVNHGLEGNFGGDEGENFTQLSEQLNERLDEVQADIDALRDDLTELIVDQVQGARQQALLSATALSLSARDLLASVEASDAVERGDIIADASRGLRDTLVQAREFVTETGEFQPSVAQVQTAFSAVGLALAVRMEVAAKLEADEIGSDRLNNQIRAAADFIRDTEGFLRDSLQVEYEIVDDDTFKATLKDVTFEEEFTDPESGTLLTRTVVLDEEMTFQRSGAFGNLQPTPQNGVFLNPYGIDALEPTVDGEPRTAVRGDLYTAFEKPLEDEALERLGFGPGGSALEATAAEYLALADGVEKVLADRPGRDDSGVLDGSPGNDLLIGASGDDVLNGLGDNDILRGGAGDDLLEGGDGQDQIRGEAGDDTLRGGADPDALTGGPGDDLIDGGGGEDKAFFAGPRAAYAISAEGDHLIVEGPAGRDRVAGVESLWFDDAKLAIQVGPVGNFFLVGDDGGDVLRWTGPDGILNGQGGDDVLLGGGAATVFIPGGGDDVARSNDAGGVVLLDDAFDDVTFSMPDPETLRVEGPSGSVELDFGFGRLELDGEAVPITRGGDADALAFAGPARNIVHDADGPISIQGGPGVDYVYAGGFDDRIDGGGGFGDTVRLFGDIPDFEFREEGDTLLVRPLGSREGFSRYTNVEFIEFDSGRARVSFNALGVPDQGFYTSSGSWIVMGRDGIDDYRTDGGAHVFYGGEGEDALSGGPADDVIGGGEDDDVLTGGDGADRFVFEVNAGDASHGVDEITDFEPGEDKIVLRGDAFRRVANGVEDRDLTIDFPPDEAEDTLFTSGRTLFVDPDGDGPGAPIAFAELSNAWSLRASDFTVEAPDPAAAAPGEGDGEDDGGVDAPPTIILGEDGPFPEVLQGTEASEAFVSRGGRLDTMIGGAGPDWFVFGAEAENGTRDRDVIQDYEVGLDVIVLEAGAEVKQITAADDLVSVFLKGDLDVVTVRGDGVSAINLTFTTDLGFELA